MRTVPGGKRNRDATIDPTCLLDRMVQSEEPYRSLVELTADAVYCYEFDPPIPNSLAVEDQVRRLPEGVLVECNDACARTYGATEPHQVLGKTLSELFPTTHISVDELYKAFILNGYQTIEGVSAETRADGTKRYYVNNAVGLVEGNALVRVWGTWRDITDRKRAEEQLRRSEARASAFLAANPDLVLRIDGEGRYLDCHVGDQATPVVPPQEMIGRKSSDFFNEDIVRKSQHHITKALETGEVQFWEYQISLQGKRRRFEARFVKSSENEVVATIREITRQMELEREVVMAGELERERIGRDLHDGVGQTLAGISFALEGLAKELAGELSSEAKRLATATQEAIKGVKRAARSLSPAISGDFGLDTALTMMAEEINQYPGITCAIERLEVGDLIDHDVATQLYRIAQEATSNALQHSGAENIVLRLTRNGDCLAIEILDDGMGIPMPPARVEGLGLRSMRYRARMINASLEIVPRIEGGTRIHCFCPIRI